MVIAVKLVWQQGVRGVIMNSIVVVEYVDCLDIFFIVHEIIYDKDHLVYKSKVLFGRLPCVRPYSKND